MPRYLAVTDPSSVATRTAHGILTGAAYKRLVVNALPGLRPDGSMPEGAMAQVEQAFDNLVSLLETAGLAREDLVRLVVHVATGGLEGLVQIAASARLGGMRASVAVRQAVSLTQIAHLVEIDAEAVQEG